MDELQVIHQTLVEIKTDISAMKAEQKIMHEFNAPKIAKMDDLNCMVHKERLDTMKIAVGGLWGLFLVVVGWVVIGNLKI